MLFLIDSSSKTFIFLPSIFISPLFILYSLQSKLNIVVLPEPLFPTNATVSLAFILNETSFNTSFSLYLK